MKSAADKIRETAENDLYAFIRLVQSNRVLGAVHEELIRWGEREGASSHQLVLLPRDHQKSAYIAFRTAWRVVKNPAIKILYISSTANLAVKQLKFIKDILSSEIVRRYWPELVNVEEAKREKWAETEISVDHPKRKEEHVRDPTIFTAGLTSNIVGMHCDILVMDDVVVNDNAYTEEGRSKARQQFSFLASIATTDSEQWVVGTRYHPKDLYHDLLNMKVDVFNKEGEVVGEYGLYEIFERQVEDRGDGTGIFLWPRQQRADGRWFGFDASILAKKKALYLDKVQFRAQYYNDPNDPEGAGIGRECFQYYDRKHLTRSNGGWYFKGSRLNVFAAVDFAFSMKLRADFTAIVVVGIDGHNNYYILDIERFKANTTVDYFKRILVLHQKWDFRKIRAEVTAAQQVIVNDLKQSYIRPHGLALSIEDSRPTRNEGSKEERINGLLQARYNNRQMWHFEGGYCNTLEEELILAHPPHDDVKDCLASCIDICVAPTMSGRKPSVLTNVISHPRFGGVA